MARAYGLGLRSVWIAAGRTWTETAFRTTNVAQGAAAAIAYATRADAQP